MKLFIRSRMTLDFYVDFLFLTELKKKFSHELGVLNKRQCFTSDSLLIKG